MIILQNIIDSKYYYQPNWVMVIIILSVMITGYLYSAFYSRFNTFLKAVFISRFSVQASREERSLSHPVSLLLSLNFLLTASLFILQLVTSDTFFHSEIEFSLASFLLIIITVSLIYFVKIIFLKIFAFILDKQEILAEYNFIIFLVNQFLGVVLIPVIIFIAYGPRSYLSGFVFLGAVLFVITFFLRVGKGLSAVLERGEASLFYLILYLCTLEFLPLLIGIKLFEKIGVTV
jgi:hypothetical protein